MATATLSVLAFRLDTRAFGRKSLLPLSLFGCAGSNLTSVIVWLECGCRQYLHHDYYHFAYCFPVVFSRGDRRCRYTASLLKIHCMARRHIAGQRRGLRHVRTITQSDENCYQAATNNSHNFCFSRLHSLQFLSPIFIRKENLQDGAFHERCHGNTPSIPCSNAASNLPSVLTTLLSL